MSNAGDSDAQPRRGDRAPRGKWASITAFGVLLVDSRRSPRSLFALIATIATVTLNGVLFLIAGAAEIGSACTRGLGPVLSVGDRRRSLSRRRRDLHRQPAARFGRPDASARRRPVAAGVVRLVSRLSLAGRLNLACWSSSPPSSRFFWVWSSSRTGRWTASTCLGTLLGVDLLFHGVGWVSFGLGLHARS